MRNLTHLSLFTGIGGLDLAAEMAGFQTVGQCEWAYFPTKVQEKHWPEVPRWRDIRTLMKEDFYERTGLRTVDIVSGGFPCQPHSEAGKMLGEADRRNMWPEFMRVVRGLRPTWFVGENVNGILSTIHECICADLEVEGYQVKTFSLPAYSVGAHHQRYRVFIVANHSSKSRLQAYPQTDPTRTLQEAWEYASGRHWDNLPGTYWAIHKPPVFGMADGLPYRMDRYRDMMTALGNAVVPQQAYPIYKAIYEIMTPPPA